MIFSAQEQDEITHMYERQIIYGSAHVDCINETSVDKFGKAMRGQKRKKNKHKK